MARTVTLTFQDGTQHVYQNVPDEVTPDQVEARSRSDFPYKSLADIRGERVAAPEKSLTERIKELPAAAVELVTGANRRTAETEALPEWGSMPEMNQLSVASAKTGLGTVMSSTPEAVKIIKANYPEVGIRQDEKGNYILRSSIDGNEYAIPPGFRVGDIPRAIAGILSFTPAGRAAKLSTMAAAGAGTQAVIEATQAATGGDFDPAEVVMAGAVPAAIAGASRAAVTATKQIRNLAKVRQPAPLTAESMQSPQLANAMDNATGEQLPPQAAAANVAPTESLPSNQSPNMSPEELGQTLRGAALGGIGSKKATRTLAQEAAPDPATLAAAERLGVTDHLHPDHLTTNQTFRQLAQLVKSQTGSEAAQSQHQGLMKVAERANDLVREIGGTSDVSTLSTSVQQRMSAIQSDLDDQAEALYRQIRREVPQQTPAPAPAVLSFIEQRAKDLGGRENLSGMEKMILAKLQPKPLKTQAEKVVASGGVMNARAVTSVEAVGTKEPTYALLDDVRRDLGGAAKRTGPFKDADSGLAKKLYGLLAEDQLKAVERLGYGDTYKAASQAVALRKSVEDDMRGIFGKQLDKSLAPFLNRAIGNLEKGDPSSFANLIRAIPEDMRQEVTASGLSGFFQRTSKGGEMDFLGFTRWFEGLKRNQQSFTALMSNLPPGAARQLTDLAAVSKGIALAKGEFLATGKAINPKVLEHADSLMGRIFEEVKRRGFSGLAAEAIGSASGAPGLATALQSATMGGKPSAMQAADKLISSPEFLRLVTSQPGKPSESAAKALANSKAFQRFYMALGAPAELRPLERWVLNSMQAAPSVSDVREMGTEAADTELEVVR